MAPFRVGGFNTGNGEVATKTRKKGGVCVPAQRKEVQSRAFVVWAQTQWSTKPDIWSTNPALLISVFVYCAAKSERLTKAAKSMSGD